ncbi:MAG: peptidoglycan DD-metalloendopeptidase family protein [Nocardioidaceae bacterium]
MSWRDVLAGLPRMFVGLVLVLTGQGGANAGIAPCASVAVAAQVGVEVGAGRPAAGWSPASNTRRFWVNDKHRYFSDWYAGKHRKMVPFGCTRAPYYDPDPRCAHQRGVHHGLDVAMPCRTRLYAGYRSRVVDPDAPGALGAAYGPHAFRLRSSSLGKDFVIGHVRRVFVDRGDRVRRGELIALASDAGAPDGCHLHFEVRPLGGSYTSAIAPYDDIRLRRRKP